MKDGNNTCPRTSPFLLATPLASLLGIPAKRGALAAQKRGAFEFDGVLVEKWLFTA